MPHLGDAGQGVNRKMPVEAWLCRLAERLRRVRVTCGDFERVLSDSVLHAGQARGGAIGVLLDPPYPAGAGQDSFYAGDTEAASVVYARALRWAKDNGDRERMRIVVCGYEGLWTPPAGWTVRHWHNTAGYRGEAGQRQEVLWCSPHCEGVGVQGTLF